MATFNWSAGRLYVGHVVARNHKLKVQQVYAWLLFNRIHSQVYDVHDRVSRMLPWVVITKT